MTMTLHDITAALTGRPILLHPSEASAMLAGFAATAGDRPGGIRARMRTWFDDGPRITGPMAYVPDWLEGEAEELDYGVTLAGNIGLINVDTPLFAHGFAGWSRWYHGYDTLAGAVQTCLDDPRVDGIFLRFDSPGGVVAPGLFELTRILAGNRAAAGKPVHVSAPRACSGAYWLAAQADRVTAPEAGVVGSIGVYILHTDVSGALERWGISLTAFETDATKTAGAWWRPIGDDTGAEWQASVETIGRAFRQAVLTGRPGLAAGLEALAARAVDVGHEFDPALSAEGIGLIDAMESEPEAFAALQAALIQSTDQQFPAAAAATDPAAEETDMPAKRTAAARRQSVSAETRARLQAAAEEAMRRVLAEEQEDDTAMEEDDESAMEDDETAEDDPDADPAAEDEEDEDEGDESSGDDEAEPEAAANGTGRDLVAGHIRAAGADIGMPGLAATLAKQRGMTLTAARRALMQARREKLSAARTDRGVTAGAVRGEAGQAASLKAAAAAVNGRKGRRRG